MYWCYLLESPSGGPWDRASSWAGLGPRGGAYQLEADLPVLPVYLGIIVPNTGRRAARQEGGARRRWCAQTLQRVWESTPEVAGAAAAAAPSLPSVGRVVFVQVKKRLFRDAVQFFQLLFNFSVSEKANGEEVGPGMVHRITDLEEPVFSINTEGSVIPTRAPGLSAG